MGGHCLPKDPWLLKFGVETYGNSNSEIRNPDTSTRLSTSFELISSARRINDGMPLHMVELIEEALGEAGVKPAGAKVAVLGVAYLENSDDTRNTPAAPLAALLRARGVRVVAHDPYVRERDWVKSGGDGVPLTRDLAEALQGADCASVVTRHREYVDLANQTKGEWSDNPQPPIGNPQSVLSPAEGSAIWGLMRRQVIVDGRNVFDAGACRVAGIIYRGVGKG